MITFHHVFREFHQKNIKLLAVNNLSFHIPEGEMVGIVGANGSGKTTILKLIVGVLEPSSGLLRTMGYDPVRNRTVLAKEMGVLFGRQSRLFEGMNIEASYELTKKMYRISEQDYKNRLNSLDDILQLSSLLTMEPKNLSLGERLRADIGMVLLTNPKLLILDEVTLGIDSFTREEFGKYLKDINQGNGTTILFSAHDVSDINRVCHRILVLKEGSLSYYGNMESLMRQYATSKTITFELTGKIPDMQDLPVEKYFIDKNRFVIIYDSKRVSSKIVVNHVLEQCNIHNIKMEESGLTEALTSLYEDTRGKRSCVSCLHENT